MYETICYARSFLKEVVARLDFVAPVASLQQDINSKFLKTITKLFPISEPKETIGLEFQFGPGESQSKEVRSKQWNFYGKNREKQLTIAHNYLSVHYTKYSTFEAAKADFSLIVESFSKMYPETQVARFGLRYMNFIEIPQIDPVTGWDRFISPDLLAGNKFLPKEEIVRLFHIVEVMKSDFSIRLQYGIANPDYPAIVKKPEFIIDIDAYIQIAHSLGESLAYMDLAHDHIQDIFEKSITSNLRESMNVKPSES